MTAFAVVFLDYPPTVLNILAPRLLRIIEERGGHAGPFGPHAAKQKSRQSRAPFFSQKGLRHAQAILWRQVFLLAGVVDLRFGQFVLKEPAMVIPLRLFLFRMQLQRIAPVFSVLGQQSEI